MIGERDERAVLLDLVGELLGLLELEELRAGMLEALLRAVPSKWASVNDVGPEGVHALVTPHLDERWTPRFAELVHENPLYQRWLETRDGRAYRFSDVCTREELEATRLYREVYAPLGIEHQIVISLPAERDRILAIVLHREDRDYTDGERDFLNLARPFLIQVYNNAIAHTALRTQSTAALEEALRGQGLTGRQAEVLRLVALGGSNRDVALRLGVSDRTVQKHLEHAFRTLGVTTRSAAAARAWQLAAADGAG
jgi:DNA-binding CsgD family transcriptional regulator